MSMTEQSHALVRTGYTLFAVALLTGVVLGGTVALDLEWFANPRMVLASHIQASMMGPLIDTLIICTITGLVILSTGVWRDRMPDA